MSARTSATDRRRRRCKNGIRPEQKKRECAPCRTAVEFDTTAGVTAIPWRHHRTLLDPTVLYGTHGFHLVGSVIATVYHVVRWRQSRQSGRDAHRATQSYTESLLPPILLLFIVCGWRCDNRLCYMIGSMPVVILGTGWFMYMDQMGCSFVPGWLGCLLYVHLTALLFLPPPPR